MRSQSQSPSVHVTSRSSSSSPILPDTGDLDMTSVLSSKNLPRSSSFRVPALSPSSSYTSFSQLEPCINPSGRSSLTEDTEDEHNNFSSPQLSLQVSNGSTGSNSDHLLFSPSVTQMYCEPPTPVGGDILLSARPLVAEDRPVPFFVCVLGIIVFYGGYSVLQELIFSDPGFQYGVFVSCVQLFMYVQVCLGQPYIVNPQHAWWNTGYTATALGSASLSPASRLASGATTSSSSAVGQVSSSSTNTLKKRRHDSIDTEQPLYAGQYGGEEHAQTRAATPSNVSSASSTAATAATTTPRYYFAILGFLSVINVLVSNISLQFLSYPLKVMLKACKLLPVVLLGTFYFKRKYSKQEWTATVLLTSGVLVCSVYKPQQPGMSVVQKIDDTQVPIQSLNNNTPEKDSQASVGIYDHVEKVAFIPPTQPEQVQESSTGREILDRDGSSNNGGDSSNNSNGAIDVAATIPSTTTTSASSSLNDQHVDVMLMIGVSMMMVSMMSDAAVTNIQERVLERYNPSTNTLVMQSKFFALGAASLVLLFSGTAPDAIMYCWEHPRTLVNILLFGILGCSGEFFVMEVIRQYGSLVAVCVTSLRKLMNVLLSFLIVPKHVNFGFFWGVTMVFLGMLVEAYAKNQKSKRKNDIQSNHTNK